jgi:hypothetical protein
MSAFPTPLVPKSVETALQVLTINTLFNNSYINGTMPPPTPQQLAAVRVGWQQQGQPAMQISEDVCFVRCYEVDDSYNRTRDVDIVPNPNDTSPSGGAVQSVTIGNGGGFPQYSYGDLVTVSETGASGLVLLVNNTSGGAFPGATGAITGIQIVSPGSGYTASGYLPVIGGHGVGATIAISSATPIVQVPNSPPQSVLQKVTYQRVWRTDWCLYGPNSFDRARQIRSALFTQQLHDTFAALGLSLYLMTAVESPRRVPELFQKQWWERTDMYAEFNEGVTETVIIPTAASVEIKAYESHAGLLSDATYALPGAAVIPPPTPPPPAPPNFYEGNGPPTFLYANGDIYFNNLNGDVYEQVENEWVLVGNVPQGEDMLPSEPFHLVSAAGTNINVIKSADGLVTGWKASNNALYPIYIKLFDKATAPVLGVDLPKQTIKIQAGEDAEVSINGGITYSNGIGFAITLLVADLDTTAVAAGDCVSDIFWQ